MSILTYERDFFKPYLLKINKNFPSAKIHKDQSGEALII